MSNGNKPIIGIPCYQESIYPDQRKCFGVNRAYVHALQAAGAAPLLIPVGMDEDTLRSIFSRLDGLLLAGGDDLNPNLYGQSAHPQAETPDDQRDDTEITLTHWALAEEMPLFAICRGIQTLNVAAGGTLIQDIPDLLPNSLQHSYDYSEGQPRYLPRHEVIVEPNSRLGSIIGERAQVNSFHHQALDTIPSIFRPVAWSPDEIVEALEIPGERFVLAVQWHPEEMFNHDPKMLALFQRFVEATVGERSRS